MVSKCLKNQSGFTVIEIVLYITVSAIVLNLTAQSLMSQVEAYEFVSQRKSALSDVRFGLNRISYDLYRLDTDDISTFSSSQIDFTDVDEDNVSYLLQDGDLLKNGEVLVSGVQALTFTGFDEAGAETAVISEIKRIKILLTTSPHGSEGSVTLTTTVMPRSFMYAGFE